MRPSFLQPLTRLSLQLAHVVILSDNRESTKRITRILGNQPTASVALADADAETAVDMVGSRLLNVVKGQGGKGRENLTRDEIQKIKMLGGRSSDLHNVRHLWIPFLPFACEISNMGLSFAIWRCRDS